MEPIIWEGLVDYGRALWLKISKNKKLNEKKKAEMLDKFDAT
jgi:hypothetical protein